MSQPMHNKRFLILRCWFWLTLIPQPGFHLLTGASPRIVESKVQGIFQK